MTLPPSPKPLTEYLRELYQAKEQQRRADARLSFDEKIAIVLELQEASALMRAARERTGARR
jgi:uncharacterized membrane protein